MFRRTIAHLPKKCFFAKNRAEIGGQTPWEGEMRNNLDSRKIREPRPSLGEWLGSLIVTSLAVIIAHARDYWPAIAMRIIKVASFFRAIFN